MKVVTELSDSETYFILNEFFSYRGNKTKPGHVMWRELPTIDLSPFSITYIGQSRATGINYEESVWGCENQGVSQRRRRGMTWYVIGSGFHWLPS